MHQFLHDYFWIYIVMIGVMFGAVFYYTPKLAIKFLDKAGGGKNRPAGKNEPGKNRRQKQKPV